VSPLLPAACRFHPTCSEYAVQAVETHGLLRGAGLSAWRLARCQPFSKGGYDPVPPPAKPGGDGARAHGAFDA
jgi:putative membrane protein insertion efficiency factor